MYINHINSNHDSSGDHLYSLIKIFTHFTSAGNYCLNPSPFLESVIMLQVYQYTVISNYTSKTKANHRDATRRPSTPSILSKHQK